MESLFTTLGQAGIARDDLYLAWDFTVASERNLSERALSIRDDAFAQLGDTNLAQPGGRGHVTAVHRHLRDRLHGGGGRQDRAPGRGHHPGSVLPERSRAARRDRRFAYAPGSSVPLRTPGNTQLANFICLIPRVAVDGPAGAAVARLAVRARAARQRVRDHCREHQVDGQRAQLRLLRHRLVRHVDPGHPEHRLDPRRPVELPVAGRPGAAGVRELHVPGPR